MTRCQIALGGNVGDVQSAFAAALRRLAGPDLRVAAVSRPFATPPMGAAAGGAYLNAAASIDTTLEPLELLDRLSATEDALGRVREVRWGPRPIDLDLILYGGAVHDLHRLRVPHPGCWYRRFVLDPIAEIAPDAVHPETGETIDSLRRGLLERPFRIAIDGPAQDAAGIASALRSECPGLSFVSPGEAPVLTLAIGGESSAKRRVVGIPPGIEGTDDAAAILAAALGEPEPAGPPISSPG